MDQVAEGARVGPFQAGFDAMEERVGIGVRQPGEGGGEGLAGAERVIRVFLDVFHVLDVELGFDYGEALEAPFGGDHFVDQVEFGGAVGLELVEVGGEELVEFGGVFGRQEQGLRGEAVLEAVLGGAFTAGFGFGAVGFCAVDAGGLGFAKGWHLGDLGELG